MTDRRKSGLPDEEINMKVNILLEFNMFVLLKHRRRSKRGNIYSTQERSQHVIHFIITCDCGDSYAAQGKFKIVGVGNSGKSAVLRGTVLKYTSLFSSSAVCLINLTVSATSARAQRKSAL